MNYEITMNDLRAANPVAHELLTNLMMAQEPSGRFKYMEAATEALNDPRGSLIQKLYLDIVRKSDMDYSDINASKGILTRYKYYDKMTGAIDSIKEVAATLTVNIDNTPAYQTYVRMHDIIIAEGKNFEMGYKFNIEFLQIVYQTLVLTLNELINVMICDVANAIKGPTVATFRPGNGTKAYERHSAMIVQQANAFIKSYERGEWAALIKTFKGNKEAFVGTALVVTGIAVAGVIAALGVIRLLIYYFWHTKTRLSDYAKDQADILRMQMMMDNDKTGEDKRQKLLIFLESKADMIESRIKKNEADATKKQEDSARSDFNQGAIKAPLNSDTDDFELV